MAQPAPYCVRLTPEQRQQLKSIAAAQGVSAHSIALKAIEQVITSAQQNKTTE